MFNNIKKNNIKSFCIYNIYSILILNIIYESKKKKKYIYFIIFFFFFFLIFIYITFICIYFNISIYNFLRLFDKKNFFKFYVYIKRKKE